MKSKKPVLSSPVSFIERSKGGFEGVLVTHWKEGCFREASGAVLSAGGSPENTAAPSASRPKPSCEGRMEGPHYETPCAAFPQGTLAPSIALSFNEQFKAVGW